MTTHGASRLGRRTHHPTARAAPGRARVAAPGRAATATPGRARVVGWGRVALTLILLAGSGCAALSPESGVGVAVGPKGDQWVVTLDPALGTPATMTNKILEDRGTPGGAAAPDASAEGAVRELFREHADWFRLRPETDDFRLVQGYKSGWLHTLRFQQTYRGIPVGGAGYDARVLSNGRVGSLEGRFYPDIQLDVTPALSADQAEDRARPWFLPGSTTSPGLPAVQFEGQYRFLDLRSLIIVPRDGRFTLAWGVVLTQGQWNSYRIYIDAASGTALGSEFVGSVPGR